LKAIQFEFWQRRLYQKADREADDE
jgi:hypothetical protein